MSLLRHRCWFCGRKSRGVEIVEWGYPGGPTSPWQCKDRIACEARRRARSSGSGQASARHSDKARPEADQKDS